MSLTLRRPRECRSTRSFRSNEWLAAFAACALLAGCGSPQPEGQAAPSPNQPVAVHVELPTGSQVSRLALIHEHQLVGIGAKLDDAMNVYPKPQRAFYFTDLPSQLGAQFTAKGWETASEAFGVILQGDRVALAMETHENADQARLEGILQTYQANFGPESRRIAGAKVSYWFWQSGRERLMLVSCQDRKGLMAVSVVVGDDALMDALRMDCPSAQADVAKADELLTPKGTEG